MSEPTTPAALDAYSRAVDRFATLLRSVPDPALTPPHMSWTVAETGAHVLSVLRASAVALGDGPPPWRDLADGPAENYRLLAATPEREPREVADALVAEVATFRAAVKASTATLMVWKRRAEGPYRRGGGHGGR